MYNILLPSIQDVLIWNMSEKNVLFEISAKKSFASHQELSAPFANGNYVTGRGTWLPGSSVV